MSAQHGCELVAGRIHPQHISKLPILVLNVHSRCNCRCVMCDIWRRDRHTELGVAALQRHRDSLRRLGVERVVLTGGEPLLHSDLPALCRFFRELGIGLTLLTTGLLAQRRASTIAEFFDDVIISLDGPAAVHDRIRRVPGAFDAIAGGVEALRDLRHGLRVSARTTVQRLNFRHLIATVDAAHELRLDGISFLAADLTSEAFNRPDGWPADRQSEIALQEDEVGELAQVFEQLIRERAADLQCGYIAESPQKLRRIVGHFRAYLGLQAPEAPRCNAPWVSAVVETDGRVRPCFFHPALVNINDMPLEEALNSSEALAFRDRLTVADDPVCRRCVCSLWYCH